MNANRLKTQMRERMPPRDYVINQFICTVPLMGPRVRAYGRIGVRFESPQTSAIMMNTEVKADHGRRRRGRDLRTSSPSAGSPASRRS